MFRIWGCDRTCWQISHLISVEINETSTVSTYDLSWHADGGWSCRNGVGRGYGGGARFEELQKWLGKRLWSEV